MTDDQQRENDVLDGRIFDMVSSTASVVSDVVPTRFRWSERDGVAWVSTGATRSPKAGEATSTISEDSAGRLVLTEDFTAPDGSPQVGVCREIVE